MVKRYKIITFGCRTNQYESQAYADQLRAMGFEEAVEGQVDFCIINSCSVTHKAEKSSFGELRRVVEKYPGAKIVMTGCAAKDGKEGVVVIRNEEKERLLEMIFPELAVPAYEIKGFGEHTRAFVKAQDGCNAFCSYCIIPYVRGRSRSRRIGDIVEEIRGLTRAGFKEIVLTGINIGDFRSPEGRSLTDLVKECTAIAGLRRIRISSIDPQQVDERLIETIIGEKKCCKSLHLVLQSGSNVVLRRMNRRYNRQLYLEKVERIMRDCPDFTFTTDIIAGFPGETESDFQDTLEMIRRVKFAKVHLFPFSPRQRTRAYSYPGRVAKEVMEERKAIILRESDKAAFALREKYLRRKLTVLTECGDGRAVGHTDNFLKVFLRGKKNQANKLVEARIIDNTRQGLVGELLGVEDEN